MRRTVGVAALLAMALPAHGEARDLRIERATVDAATGRARLVVRCAARTSVCTGIAVLRTEGGRLLAGPWRYAKRPSARRTFNARIRQPGLGEMLADDRTAYFSTGRRAVRVRFRVSVSCRAGRTLAETREGRVFRVARSMVYGCLKRPNPSVESAHHVTAGRYAAHEETISERCTQSSVVVFDLGIRGRRMQTHGAGGRHESEANGCFGTSGVSDLLVHGRTGEAFWIDNPGDDGLRRVHVGATVVDEGPDIEPGSLRLSGYTLSWRRGGVANQRTV